MLEEVCRIDSIPDRLHSIGKGIVKIIADTDFFYMRHERIEGAYLNSIPNHRVEDQSVHSKLLNLEFGCPEDVLYDSKNGNHFAESEYSYAVFDHLSIKKLDIPNLNTIMKKDGIVVKNADRYTFKVKHDPTPCIYPHCEIILVVNDREKEKLGSRHMKALIRTHFARIAEKNRPVV